MSTTSNFNTVRVLSKSEFENNFSSTSNDTLYFVEMDNTMFDGQWVIRTSPAILNTSTQIGTYNLDLSTYLPNDNYNYELLMFDYVSRSGSKGNNTIVLIWNGDIGQNVSNADVDKNTFFSRIECDGPNFQQANNSFVAIVSSTRTIKKTIVNYNASVSATGLIGYRRIGTNE